jgi:hypothetical protein
MMHRHANSLEITHGEGAEFSVTVNKSLPPTTQFRRYKANIATSITIITMDRGGI